MKSANFIRKTLLFRASFALLFIMLLSATSVLAQNSSYTVSVSNSLPDGVTVTVNLPFTGENQFASSGVVVTFSYTNNGVAAGYVPAFYYDYMLGSYPQHDPVPTDNGDGTYSFWMPSADVTITAELKKDISSCTVSVPDQTMRAYNSVYHYIMDWNNIIYKFDAANYPEYNGYFVGEVVKDGNDTLTLSTDYQFGAVEVITGDGSQPGDSCRVEIVGYGEYSGTKWANFKIIGESASGTWGNLTWNLQNDTLSISLTNPDGGNMHMKDTTSNSGYPWYPYGSYITTITIGNGVTSIADNAFAGTSNVNTYGSVTTVSLPSTLDTIGDYAFAYCNSATIKIPTGVTSFGAAPFNQVGRYDSGDDEVKGGVVATLFAMGDNSALISALASANYANVTIQGLTLHKDGSWNTLCLPFDVPTATFNNSLFATCSLKEVDLDGYYDADNHRYLKFEDKYYLDGQEYTIDASSLHQTGLTDNGTLYLYFYNNGNQIDAGKPYIIRWDKPDGYNNNPGNFDIVDPTFNNVRIISTTGSEVPFTGGCFKGTFNKVNNTTGKLFDAHNSSHKAFHAYISAANMTTDGTTAATSIPFDNNLQYPKVVLHANYLTLDFTTGQWQAFSSPVHDAGKNYVSLDSVTNLKNSSYDLFRYSETYVAWENQKNHNDFNSLAIGSGYIYRSSTNRTLTFKSLLNDEDSYNVTLSASGSGDFRGFNLIGNPYPFEVQLNREFYSLNADGSWTAHASGDNLAIGQGALVHTTTDGEVLTFYASTHNTNQCAKGFLPSLPENLNFNLNDNVNFNLDDNVDFVRWDGDQLIIEGTGTLQVFDILGRKIFSQNVNSQLSILNCQFPSGVYVLRLGTKTQKIVIR